MSFLERFSKAHNSNEGMKWDHSASYVELTKDEASSRDLSQLLQFIPEDFEVSDLAFRVINLPTNIHRRKRRVEEIIQKGTDKTKYFHKTNFWLINEMTSGWKTPAHYTDVARRTGINLMDIIYASDEVYFQKSVRERGLYNSLGIFSGNAVLVYDAKTQSGLKPLSVHECTYTFQNSQQKRIALLGVIAVK